MEDHQYKDSDMSIGAKWLQDKRCGVVFFSRGTYQIEVKDPETKESFFPFYCLDEEGVIKESFCTCEKYSENSSCPHITTGYLRIFNHLTDPLHVRFDKSIWYQVFWILAHRHGFDAYELKGNEKKGFKAENLKGKCVFSLNATAEHHRERLKTIILDYVEETEENSLKFSNVSQFEKEHPTPQFNFELSFWSDLAKYFQYLQDTEGDPNVELIGDKNALPTAIKLTFKGISFELRITQPNWRLIVPTLSAVHAPVKGHSDREKIIDSFTLVPEKREMQVALRDNELWDPHAKEIEVGEWIYLPAKGFFPTSTDQLLHKELLNREEVGYLLGAHTNLLTRKLRGSQIHPGRYSVNYTLSFDSKNQLHITSYIHQPGDLDHPNSDFYDHWAYIDGKGFYHVHNRKFDCVESMIPSDKVSDFVNGNKIWLAQFDGFQTYSSDLDSKMTYHLDPESGLRFGREMDLNFDEEMRDFGDWVYLSGKGFYSKSSSQADQAVRTGIKIAPDEISPFIEDNHDELESVHKFFSKFVPIEKMGLQVSIGENEEIICSPVVLFKEGYSRERVTFYGKYTHVKGEGFSVIPRGKLLPSDFRQEKVIPKTQEHTFLSNDLEELGEFIVDIDPRLVKPVTLELRVNHLKHDPKYGRGGYLVNFEYVTDKGQFSPHLIWEAKTAKKNYLFSPGGLILTGQQRFAWLRALKRNKWIKKGVELRLTALELIKLSIYEKLAPPETSRWGAKETTRMMDEILSLSSSMPIVLTGLESQLREYQEAGLNWLWFLYCHGLSGLLCDDMGLGKTHQAMSLLAAAHNCGDTEKAQGKYIVVCPTSVIYHWEDLLQRFFPTIRVLVFYGTGRSIASFDKEADILLTSYGTLRQEVDVLTKIPFDIAIYDEIQIAKNARSQTHKVVKKIDAKMRLGLSGTPIENYLIELKALFDLVLPGYFPSTAVYREMFVNPIEHGNDDDRKELLKKWIAPFILRRKKTDVLLELPSKTEEISHCELSEDQKKLYKEVMRDSKDAIITDLKDDSKPVNYVHIFEMLTRLKQICDHPALYRKNVAAYEKSEAGKWELFKELLDEARSSGQKVVVFSQYLGMLDIIEKHLKKRHIKFAGIRGNTRDRKEQLKKFKEDPKCEVFVASLQAAGVGIDLVSASVVIHYDRWWNPAKENQATDRVHRMGQSRGVQVFKLVNKNSIEEHIHKLIEKKHGLSESIIGYDDINEIEHLDRSEIIELLNQSDIAEL